MVFNHLFHSKINDNELQMEASEPKWVNPNDIQYVVNSLRLGGLQIIYKRCLRTSRMPYFFIFRTTQVPTSLITVLL